MEFQSPILVTGASGYLASRIVHLLLDRGLIVHATVRDPSREDRVAHLKKAEQNGEGILKLFAADLLVEGSFDEAMQGCVSVIHTASPFQISGIKNAQQQLVDPAIKGTANVLNSVNRTDSVTRVALTSSVASVYGDAVEIRNTEAGLFNEQDWNETSSLEHQPYSFSKVSAEKEAWKMADAQDRWRLVTINPAFILGPSLTARKDSTSIDFMISMVNGKMRMGAPDLYFGVVDVRDVAMAHLLAISKEDAEGRFILCNRSMSMLEIGATLRRLFPGKYTIPKNKLPKFLVYLFGPLQAGLSWRYIRDNVGHEPHFDNSKSLEQLGVIYRPVEETFAEQIQQLERDGLLR